MYIALPTEQGLPIISEIGRMKVRVNETGSTNCHTCDIYVGVVYTVQSVLRNSTWPYPGESHSTITIRCECLHFIFRI